MSALYPLTKGDIALEVKGVLQEGGTRILNFILSEMYEGRNPDYDYVARRFEDKIPSLDKLLEYRLLFDSHETGERVIFLSFVGFMFCDDYEIHAKDLEKIFSFIAEKYRQIGQKGEIATQEIEKAIFGEVVDVKKHKILIVFLRLLERAPGGHVISIFKKVGDGLMLRAYIDILKQGPFNKYIGKCIEGFNKSFKASLDNSVPDLTNIGIGGLIGRVNGNVKIDNCSVKDFKINGFQNQGTNKKIKDSAKWQKKLLIGSLIATIIGAVIAFLLYIGIGPFNVRQIIQGLGKGKKVVDKERNGITFDKGKTPILQSYNVSSNNQSEGVTVGSITNNFVTNNTYFLNQLQSLEEQLYSTLSKKYPLGYKLFAFHNSGKSVLHNESSKVNGCLVDWDSAKVGVIAKDFIEFEWPSIRISVVNNGYGRTYNGEIAHNFGRMRRFEGEINHFSESVMLPFDEYAEIIKNDSEAVYVVIGFREKGSKLRVDPPYEKL